MRLYLVRHGEAKSKQEDPDRPLTPAGEASARRVAAALARLRPPLRGIWHSGKLRAEQTAQLFDRAFGALAAPAGGRRPAPEARADLEPEASPRGLVEELQRVEGELLIVGHLPHLARLASALVFGTEAPQAFDLAAASVLCLERTGECWSVEWLLTPELCG